MLLHKAQKEIAKSTNRFRVLVCGRKFGKTSLASEEIKGAILTGDRKRVLYIAPTLLDARRLMWDRLIKELEGAIISKNDTRLEIEVGTLDGGKNIIFLGSWEKVQNYRGDEFDFVILDEVQDYRNFWVGWHEALRPTLSPRKGTGLFMGTPKGFNHFYDLYGHDSEDPDYKGFHFTSYDNPHVDKEEIEKAKLELTEDRFAQEYLADFRKQEGLVYKEFDRDRHLVDDLSLPENVSDVILGIDFGFTNPTAVLEIHKYGDNQYCVVSEWYKPRKTKTEIAEYATSLEPNIVYPDPEDPEAIQKLEDMALNCHEVNKDVVAGIDRVRELFKQNKITIHKNCKNLIAELESYAYPERRPGKNEDEKPIKDNDHAVDALRYALFMNSQMSPVTTEIPQFKGIYSQTYE